MIRPQGKSLNGTRYQDRDGLQLYFAEIIEVATFVRDDPAPGEIIKRDKIPGSRWIAIILCGDNRSRNLRAPGEYVPGTSFHNRADNVAWEESTPPVAF